MLFRIAIIEDDQETLKKLKNHLLIRNYQVTGYGDSSKAVPDIKRMHHKIVLLSLNLANGRSLQTLTRIQRHNPIIQIFCIAEDENSDVAKEALKMGVKGIFEKPFDSLQMIEKEIEKAVDCLDVQLSSGRR